MTIGELVFWVTLFHLGGKPWHLMIKRDGSLQARFGYLIAGLAAATASLLGLAYLGPSCPALSAPATALLGALGSAGLAPTLAGLAYEARAFTEVADFLAYTQVWEPCWSFLMNPAADLDFTTSTDFEDLSGPVADIMEMAEQDRALGVDAVASTLFWDFAAGFLAGGALHCVLSPSFWRALK